MGQEITIPKDLDIDKLIAEAKTYVKKSDLDLIRLAFDFANKAHEGQKRKSGEPYIIHPLSAAYILAKMKIEVSIRIICFSVFTKKSTANIFVVGSKPFISRDLYKASFGISFFIT